MRSYIKRFEKQQALCLNRFEFPGLLALLHVELGKRTLRHSQSLSLGLRQCHHSTVTLAPSSSHFPGRVWRGFCSGFGVVFLNKTALSPLHCEPSPAPSALRAPPQDGARRPEVSLRQLPEATVRHGRDAAGAEPDAALEPVRGAGGGAAGPRGVAAGESEARPGLLGRGDLLRGGETGREKRAAREPPVSLSP